MEQCLSRRTVSCFVLNGGSHGSSNQTVRLGGEDFGKDWLECKKVFEKVDWT